MTTWTRRQRWKNDAIYLLVRLLFAVVPRVPRSTLRSLGEGIGWLLGHGLGRHRRIAEENLAHAFPRMSAPERRDLARRSFRRLGGWLGEALAVATGRPLQVLPLADDGGDVLRAAMAEGRGVVLVSAHLGPWEQVASSLVAHGVALVTVTRGAYDPRLDFVYRRLRNASGVTAIERGTPGSTARIVRVLRGGGVLGAPMDLSTRARSVESTFLGRPARTAVGPARLALATGAAVLVVTAREDGALRVERISPEPALDGTFETRRSREAAATRLTRRLNDALGERILAFPEGWVWMHERFAEPSGSVKRSSLASTASVRSDPQKS